MKRLMLALVTVALGGLATVALAGDYHVGTLLICSDCHVMHGQQSHANADTTNGVANMYANVTGGPYPKLLRGETETNACLNCHNGRIDAPDVLGNGTNPPPNGRRAGALTVDPSDPHGLSNDDGYEVGDGHTLFSTASPPGAIGTPPVSAEGLQCGDCHRVHGNKYYRNMNGYPNATPPSYIGPAWQNKEVTYEVGGTPTDTVWVYESLPHNYDDANVNYEEKDQHSSAYGDWCGTCHGSFHGDTTSTNIKVAGVVVRHPTAGVDITTNATTWKNTSATHRLKVMDAAGKWDGTSTNMTPSCFTCHKSHGSKNSFGLIYVLPNSTAGTGGPVADPTRLAAMTEQGDGGHLRDTCRNCHSQGSFPKGNPTNILP
jgi:hypothetical protein